MSTASFEPTRKLIESEFSSGWGSRTPIKWQNVPFEPPQPKSDYVAFSIILGASLQVSFGPTGQRRERTTGLAQVQIFTPDKEGTATAFGHADFASAIFRMKTVKDSDVTLVFRTPQVFNLGEVEEWFNLLLQVEFQLDAVF